MDVTFSDDDIRALANLEREMTAGQQPYVVCDGSRWAFKAELLSRLGMKSGQTISGHMLHELMRRNIADLEREIEQRKNLQ